MMPRRKAAVEAAKSDVEKYQTLVGYTRIVAPFDGVITKRYADPGSLIQAGTASNTQAMPLVRVSNNMLLRLDFPVSVDYVHGIHLDAPVRVRVDSLGGRVLTGKIARFSDRVDDSTRTMVAEMEVPNPALELVPGHVRQRRAQGRRTPAGARDPDRGAAGRRQERARGQCRRRGRRASRDAGARDAGPL